MSWKIALVVALLNAIITAVVTIPVADRVTKAHGVSDFEGGRGMAIAFVLIPAGFIGGFLLGLLGTKLAHATEWLQFWKAAGISIGLGQLALFSIAGLSLLSIPRPPLLQGNNLSLEVEVHVPLARINEELRQPGKIRLSLYAGPKDNHYARIDTADLREENGHLIVPAVASLNSRSYQRSISFHLGDDLWFSTEIDLAASPKEEDKAWTALQAMRVTHLNGFDDAPSGIFLRYRVVDTVD